MSRPRKFDSNDKKLHKPRNTVSEINGSSINYEYLEKTGSINPIKNYDTISQEQINYAKRIAKEYSIHLKMLSNRKTTIDYYTLAEKYQKILFATSRSRKTILTTNNHKYDLDSDDLRDLLVLFFTDPTCNYYAYYDTCKLMTDDMNLIIELMRRKYGFYSYKLLLLETRAKKIVNDLNDNKSLDGNSSSR